MKTNRSAAKIAVKDDAVKTSRKPLQVTITKVGTSAGIILPKSVLQQLKAERGQKLFVTEIPGGIKLSRFDPDFERQMKYAYEAMDLYPDTFKELAK